MFSISLKTLYRAIEKRIGQMLSNMWGQVSNTVQQVKEWIGHQAQQVKQAANHILEKEIPLTQPKVAIAGAGSAQVGKGVTFREASQNIQCTFSSNHQVTHTPKDSILKSEGKHVSHTNYSRENIKRIEPISISSKRNIKHDEKEFYRQLKDQEEGLNKLTVKEYMDNREKHIKNGRDI